MGLKKASGERTGAKGAQNMNNHMS